MVDTEHFKIDIKKIYSDDYFFGDGAGYPNYLEEKNILIEHGRNYGKILAQYIGKPGRVLDVGAASGFILKGLTESGWEGQGVEANDGMGQYAREQLGLDVQSTTIESFRTEKRFDLICLIQVIAHLADPRKVIQSLSNMLSGEGYVLIETWNYRSWTARLLGKSWHEYSVPVVLHWFSRHSLNCLMLDFGFELIDTGRPAKKIIAKYAKFIVNHKLNRLRFASFITKLVNLIPDKTVWQYYGDDLFWSLYRKTSINRI
jgi:SAM-dependent methyltransferase